MKEYAYDYRHPSSYIPDDTEHLIIRKVPYSRQSIDMVIPPSVKQITAKGHGNRMFGGNATHLIIDDQWHNTDYSKLTSVTHMVVNDRYHTSFYRPYYPPNLKYLELCGVENPKYYIENNTLPIVPETVTHLVLNESYNINIPKLPKNLECFEYQGRVYRGAEIDHFR
jgi:hypothetical protein